MQGDTRKYEFYFAVPLVSKVPELADTVLVSLKVCEKGPVGDLHESDIVICDYNI